VGKLNYAWEKSHKAALSLATVDAPLRDRLGSAWGHHLDALTMPGQTEQIPEPLRDEFVEIRGAFHEGVDRLDDAELHDLAGLVVSFHIHVVEHDARLDAG
jgi:hypothetical protein